MEIKRCCQTCNNYLNGKMDALICPNCKDYNLWGPCVELTKHEPLTKGECITCNNHYNGKLNGDICLDCTIENDLWEPITKSKKYIYSRNGLLNCKVQCVEAYGNFELNKIYEVKDGHIIGEKPNRKCDPAVETIEGLNEVYDSKFVKVIMEPKLVASSGEIIKKQLKVYEQVAGVPKDNVHKVSHYNQGDIEIIYILEQACQGLEGVEGGYIFTILRYLLRWKHKGGIEDLKKAYEYLGRMINILENGKYKWKF